MRVGLGDCISGFDDESGETCSATAPGAVSPITGGNCIYGVDTNGNCLNAPYMLPGTGPTIQPLPTSLPGAPQTGGSSSSNSIAAFLNQLTGAASAAVRSVTTPAPYYISGPNGQSVLYNPATGTVGNAASLSAVGLAGGSSGLMLLALAAVAIFALEKR
jgi:hypothetical protein